MIKYKNITTAVRSQKVVTFINLNDKYWTFVAQKVIEQYSELWGGAFNLIIPTDGKQIKEEFWKILERYDLDYFYAYTPIVLDLKEADSHKYERIIKSWEDHLKRKYPDMSKSSIDDFISREVNIAKRINFKIEERLEEELKNRLSPFYFREHVTKHFSASSSIGYPLTRLIDIIQNRDEKPVVYYDFEERYKNPLLNLNLYSFFGKVNQRYVDELRQLGFIPQKVPTSYPLHDILEDYVEEGLDPTRYKLRDAFSESIRRKRKAWRPTDDYTRYSPYSVSMLKLRRYYEARVHRDYEEPVILVIGDSVEDFCLYYCLSKMHEGVFWLPYSLLNKHVKARQKKMKSRKSLTELEAVPVPIINTLYKKVSYGHSEKKIILTSVSLTISALERIKNKVAESAWSQKEELLKVIMVSKDIDQFLSCAGHVLEENNYVNQQVQVFENNDSVGFIETPKPKNFAYIDPRNHRWVSEVFIKDYQLPKLHFLGHQAVLLEDGRDVRASDKGLCYLCPNVGYFGGDIDVVLVRPKLRLVDPLEVFRGYFEGSGYNLISLSDKGRFAEVSTEKFGSLDSIAGFFSKEKNRLLFDKFLIKTSKDDSSGEVVHLDSVNRTYIDFREIKTSLGGEVEAVELIDRFVQRGIFHRGYIFQCKRCLNSNWYDVSEVTNKFICKRCGESQYYGKRNWKSPEEPRFYYMLDEVVFRGYEHNMFVPLLTLNKLKTGSDSFLYLHELEIKKRDNQSEPNEIDLCCIVDGKLVIGEAKLDKVTSPIVDQYKDLSNSLFKYPDKVVFSSFKNDLSNAAKQKISTVMKSELLLKKDLVEN